jgi:hypothetical protein
MTFNIGDRVWYVLAGLGNIPPIWVAAVVERVTRTRVGLGVTGSDRRVRYVSMSRLTTDPPPPGVTVIGRPELPPIGPELQGPELPPQGTEIARAPGSHPGGYAATAWKGRGGPVPALAHVFAENTWKHQ